MEDANPQTDATPAAGFTARPRKRRANPRKPVDEAAELHLLHPSCVLACQIVDLSLGGCRVRTRDRFLAGTMARVEVSFNLKGVRFRLSGVTQWTDRRNLVGIRFLDLPPRRLEALAETFEEIDSAPQG